MLTLDGVSAGYRGLRTLHDVSLTVADGEIVALVGANGAGKTTTLRTISGFLRPTAGRIRFADRDIAGTRPSDIVRAGLVQVPEGRDLFGPLTVVENLEMGGYTQDAATRARSLREVYELFPILAERAKQPAETMSGGQQQMLAIARALMARPRLLMLDEPSVGLAPKLVGAVLDAVRRIRDHGVTVLLVEQNAAQALSICDRAYVLESGAVAMSGRGTAMVKDPRVRRAYLGM
ncbi:MAG: ATP-binding cassette domain-containing protein [Streptosporangiales bacterium]|nr:ATP-binding cassette domain-containing protein [Streptosporangiales bacterium]